MLRPTTFLAAICFCFLATAHFSFAAGYQLSMLPSYSTGEINKRITALAEYLSEQSGLQITPKITSTFDQYLKQLTSGAIDIGYQSPYVYVLASKEHDVIAMAIKGRDGDKSRGIIVTSSDSPLRLIGDLKNKKISIVGYTSAGGFMSQKLTLKQNGLDVDRDCLLSEAAGNRQENVIISVSIGDVDAGFIRESALHKADEFIMPGSIKIIAETAWLPNWAFSVDRYMAQEHKEAIIAALLKLSSDGRVLQAMGLTGFKAATDSDYDVMRRLIE